MARLILQDASPVTPAEHAIRDKLPETCIWCCIREQQLDVVICARLQHEYWRRCFRADCHHLDAGWADRLNATRNGDG
jgi:hypothetical protein